MAGMTTELQKAPRGPVVAFPPGGDAVIKIRSGVESEGFDAWKPIDDQMDQHERLRLLYVAATRAKDHLIVCLHRKDGAKPTIASVLAEHALTSPDATPLAVDTAPLAPVSPPAAVAVPDRATWATERADALALASVRRVVSATTLAREAADADDPGLAKRVRDLDLPPWQKGRYGTAVGRAVHGVLQVVDLATGDGLAEAAAAQAVAEGVANRTDVVERLARAGVGSAVARAAAASRHWRELWVAAPVGDRLVEGYVDLLYRDDEGLVVVDWKTDHLDGDDDVAAKLARYRLQGASYVAAVEAATGEPVVRMVFAFLAEDGSTEAELPDLRAGVDEVRASVGELAESATVEPLAEL
jgi:ATP-dependent exoDNAse (exonuclease V) beta subunit